MRLADVTTALARTDDDVPGVVAARHFVDRHGAAALRREGGPEHLTASCFVFSPDLEQTLLCLHRKGGFWVQFGGHLEPDDRDLADTARREAREESGIADLELLDGRIVDVDRHDLHDGFGRCAAHWDVGFVALVDPSAATAASDESDDVRWFPVGALPDALPSTFPRRLLAARDAARRSIGTPVRTDWPGRL
ncbi:NUDIX hydrolase [Curtobacterium sp. 'Ferrero']|uniref:NUDIX hydrolase n=1 Tax=Curtobacterium sp. 'Ferrero' TaxID=2033654 RepID=UPI000BCC391E|nr:NUDIX domain-containing protein [Curtobacterium sp. 'Ferrero']PCN47460.1 NUDIX hydrolase [Curtobacterium sp. 'Ferrero']